MKQNIIFIVIPVHNRINQTQECLKSIYSQAYKYYEVIVVDDGSTDNTESIIEEYFPWVTVLKGDGALWWAGAMNIGVKYAISHGAEYILSLNNDTKIPPLYLEIILEHANTRQIVGSVAVSENDCDTIIDGAILLNEYTAKRTVQSSGKSIKSYANIITLVDALSGRGTLIPACVFEDTGLYNSKSLPQYGADYELTIRARKKYGYTLMVNYNAIVISSDPIIKNRYATLSWRDIYNSFFDIRSSNCIRYRVNFGILSFGIFKGIIYIISDISRLFLSTLRNKLLLRSDVIN